MAAKLKKLQDQVMVITGASSGIGLATARMAAKGGAKLVLAARSAEALRELTDEIASAGGEAISVTADVANEVDVQRIADAAVDRFGGFDTWINNAGVAVYGKLLEVPLEDMRRVFETNVWGLLYGSLAAARHFKARANGTGAIINIGSTLSDRAIALQGSYSASKHAVKGFTDALRMELEMDGIPAVVTLIKPGAIDTPYPHHGKNYMDAEPQNPPPDYAPETVARAILHCAETPERDVFVGAGGKLISTLGQHVPRLTDKLMERRLAGQQKTSYPPYPREQNVLDRPSEQLRERGGYLSERGGYEGHVAESSLYTYASLHPYLTAVLGLGAGLALATMARSARLAGAAHK